MSEGTAKRVERSASRKLEYFHYPFNVHGLNSDGPSLISDIERGRVRQETASFPPQF